MTPEQLTQLQPYIAGRPDERGEVDLYCPLHQDSKPSASLNMRRGAWCCHAGCGGSSVQQLIDAQDLWLPAAARQGNGGRPYRQPTQPVDLAILELAARKWWHSLMESSRALHTLYMLRGITVDTAWRARIGWNGVYYKVPVFRPDRHLWNVRTYDPHATERGGRKMWNARGHGEGRLYPIGVLGWLRPGDKVLLCEGEWDTLLALQAGQPAVTYTSGAGNWHPDWSSEFEGLDVYLCHDADTAGVQANHQVGAALRPHARHVRVCRLPFDIRPSNGLDLTDYLRDAPLPNLAIRELMEDAIDGP